MNRKPVNQLELIYQNVKFAEDYLAYECKNLQTAKQLRRMFESELAAWSARLQKPELKIKYPGGSLKISATMALSSVDRSPENITVVTADSLRQVYNNPKIPVTSQLHNVMGRMIESDRPMFLLCNETDDQVWLNQLACDMIQSSGEVAIRRCMRNYWEGAALEDLHRKLRDTSQPFEHPYRAILNDEQPDVWFSAVSRYEPVEINGQSYRISINKHFDVIGKAGLVAYSK